MEWRGDGAPPEPGEIRQPDKPIELDEVRKT